jgi:TIR domain
MQLFISYARPDRSRAESLTLRLRQAGITVWLDSDLVGGQAWWDRILDQLRTCDAVVAAVSQASINSQACRSEREYATKLGKPILPLTLEPISYELLPQDIARIQVIDYSEPGEEAAFGLVGAILGLPKPGPLPEPLPDDPPVPTSPFGSLVDRIAEPDLTMDAQLEIIGRLDAALGPVAAPHDRQTAIELLRRMEERPDLFAAASRQIEKIRARLAADAIPGQRAPAAPAPDWKQSPGSGQSPGWQKSPGWQQGPGDAGRGSAGPGPGAAQDGLPAPAGPGGNVRTAVIAIGRPIGDLQDRLNAWVVLIDGRKVGKIRQGQRQEYPIYPGTHQLQVKVSGYSTYSSQVEVVTLGAGECASFACGLDHPLNMRNALSAAAWKDQFLAPRTSYIRLIRE